jgi:hypothetical protein
MHFVVHPLYCGYFSTGHKPGGLRQRQKALAVAGYCLNKNAYFAFPINPSHNPTALANASS